MKHFDTSNMPATLLRGLLSIGIAASLAACADGGESIRILRNQAPGDGCEVPTQQNADFIARGIIDVEATSGYVFTPLVQNIAESIQGASRIVFLEGADVDLVFPDGLYAANELADLKAQGLNFFRQPLSGSIQPGGVAGLAFEVIPTGMLDSLAGKIGDGEAVQVIAEIQLVGEIDGSDISSAVFKYPIQVCKGCLLNNLGSCDAIDGFEISLGGACQVFQDGFVDCCTDGGDNLVCPAVPTSGE